MDVLLVNHPLPVNEEVTLLEHNLEPRPDRFLHPCRYRRPDMFQEQVVCVIKALDDTSAMAPHDCLVPGHARRELLPCEDFKKCHDLRDSVCGSLVEEAFSPSLLSQVIGQGVFQSERSPPTLDRPSTVSAAARGPQTGQKAVAP